jgi:hypothetical protein
MIYPKSADLLAGVAAALEETVLPELARGGAARRQMQAALGILRRLAFALPGEAASLAADIEDMEEVLGQAAAIWESSSEAPSPPPNPPPSRGRALDHVPPPRWGRLGGGDLSAEHQSLQESLAELQSRVASSPELSAQITPLLTDLYKRMTDRALALIPPPKRAP